ncbi:hypothetical protein D3C86_1379580 [compost metagenome]
MGIVVDRRQEDLHRRVLHIAEQRQLLSRVGHVREVANADAVDQGVPGLGVIALVARHELTDEIGLLHNAVGAFAVEHPVRFILQVARHQFDQLRLDELLPALTRENRWDRFCAVQQLTARQGHQIAQAHCRKLATRFQLQAQVFAVYQRTGNHERLQAVAGFADQLLVARQVRRLTTLEQLHVRRRIVLNHRTADRVVGAGGLGPGHWQRRTHEFRIRMGRRLGQHQIQLECVVRFDNRSDLAFIESAQHFFGQRKPAGRRRQFSGIARGSRVAQCCQCFAANLVCGAPGSPAQATGYITGTARQVVQAGWQFLPLQTGFG